MQWIKDHLSVVIAGAVSLLAVVALVLGIFMTDVASAMSGDTSLVSSLQSPSGVPNSALAELKAQQLARHKTLLEELSKAVQMTGDHQPLAIAKDLFPKVNQDNQNAPFEFQKDYRKAQQALITDLLKAQDKPTEGELVEAADKIKRLVAQDEIEKDKPKDPKGPKTGPKPLQPTPGGPTPNAGKVGLPQLGPDATPEERVRLNPLCHAAVSKAHRKGYYCYASLNSLDQRPAITESSQRPMVEDMWYAQVSLWIQEDILGAFARLNEQRAKELPADAEKWVGNMPFKHLLAFTVGGYVPAPASKEGVPNFGGGPVAGSGGDMIGGPPPMSADAVISKHGCSDTVDVIQFTVEMIVEAKSLPDVIEKISESGYYTVLQLSYEVNPPDFDMDDYIYGSQPTLHAWLVCEGSLLRSNKTYEKLMPEAVRAEIKAGHVVGGSSVGAPGGGGPSQFGPRMGPMGPMGPGGPRGRPGMVDPRFGQGHPGA
jgi:hypothetical protein